MALEDNFKGAGVKINQENAAEYGKRGGIASGESKRRKKAMREVIEQLMATPLTKNKGKKKKLEQIKSLDDLKDVDIDVQTAIITAQVKKAIKGDVVAATFLRDTMGENPTVLAKIEAKTENTTTVKSESNLKQLAEDLFGSDD